MQQMNDQHDPLQVLNALAEWARQEPAPPVDVSQAVMNRLHRSVSLEQRTPLRPLTFFAAASLAIACIAAILGNSLLVSMADPILFLVAVP